MNERIKLLAEQAGASYYNTYTGPLLSPKDIEKFAELIIQQCVMICLNNQIKNENISAGECAYDIQEHFGVD